MQMRWKERIILAAAALVILITGLAIDAAARGDQEMAGIRRQISILTKVYDAALVESPYVLVAGRSVSHGAYLEGYGVSVGARISLEMPDDWDWGHWPFHGIRLKKKDSRRVIVIDDDEVWTEEEEDDKDRESKSERWARRWKGAREEMTQLLIDHGPSVRNLRDDEKVAIVLYRHDAHSGDDIPQTMIIEAAKRDLTRYGSGQISEEDLRQRINVIEY